MQTNEFFHSYSSPNAALRFPTVLGSGALFPFTSTLFFFFLPASPRTNQGSGADLQLSHTRSLRYCQTPSFTKSLPRTGTGNSFNDTFPARSHMGGNSSGASYRLECAKRAKGWQQGVRLRFWQTSIPPGGWWGCYSPLSVPMMPSDNARG